MRSLVAFQKAIVFTALVLGAMLLTHSAAADQSHTVKQGQTLSQIARKYGVSVRTLQSANRIHGGEIYEGQRLRIPSRGIVYVGRGDTLSRIAARHGTTVAKLARVNRLKKGAKLRIGQRLKLPGYKREARAEKRWGTPKRRGRVKLYRIATKERLTISLTDRRGRVRRAARSRMRRFLRERNTDKTRTPNRRLLALLARVSDHFGGRRIHVISGYRTAGGYTKKTSRHTKGRAIDFRIEGVPLRTLRNYCRRFSNVGVGYYPRSKFIHLDVRGRSAYWIDRSGPGEKPRYVRSGSSKRRKSVAKKAKSKKAESKKAESKKAESKKAESKKAESKKAESKEQRRDDGADESEVEARKAAG